MQIAISINSKRKSMKNVLSMIFSVILVAFLSMAFTNTKSYVDNDVGYFLALDDQNIEVTTIFRYQYQVIPGESFILLDRGVSVPDKGLMIEEINYSKIKSSNYFLCGQNDRVPMFYDRYKQRHQSLLLTTEQKESYNSTVNNFRAREKA